LLNFFEIKIVNFPQGLKEKQRKTQRKDNRVELNILTIYKSEELLKN